jgi:hypothetical protein
MFIPFHLWRINDAAMQRVLCCDCTDMHVWDERCCSSQCRPTHTQISCKLLHLQLQGRRGLCFSLGVSVVIALQVVLLISLDAFQVLWQPHRIRFHCILVLICFPSIDATVRNSKHVMQRRVPQNYWAVTSPFRKHMTLTWCCTSCTVHGSSQQLKEQVPSWC